MTNGKNDNSTEITLKGSVDIVSDFFFTAINSILYQRGIYQPETFSKESKYGLTVMTTTDPGLLRYLQSVQKQVKEWLLEGYIQRLVVVVQGVDSMETLERWQFNVSVEDESMKVGCGGGGGVAGGLCSRNGAKGNENTVPNQFMMKPSSSDFIDSTKSTLESVKTKSSQKTLKEIHNEIQAIIRQITASVTFLPLLQEPCTFDLLVYTDNDVAAPEKWVDSDPCYILHSAEVKLRSFTTSVHKVDSMVAYKEADEWDL